MLIFHRGILFLFCLNEAGSFHSIFTDFYLESIQAKYNDSKFPFASINASLRRNRNGHPKIFFDFDLTDSLKNYEVEVKIYYSPLGNRHFLLLPFKYKRQSMCEISNVEITHQLIESMQLYSNLPPYDMNVNYNCQTLKMGHYCVHNYEFDKNIFLKFVPTGRFRLSTIFYEKKKNEVLQIIEILATFT